MLASAAHSVFESMVDQKYMYIMYAHASEFIKDAVKCSLCGLVNYSRLIMAIFLRQIIFRCFISRCNAAFKGNKIIVRAVLGIL